MSILSQIGVLILIGCIIFILIRSNKSLEEASEEGEHFVDEWELRQQKIEKRKLQKEEKQRGKLCEQSNMEDVGEIEETPIIPENMEKDSEDEKEDSYVEHEKIIPMNQYKNPGITLVQLDEAHRPMARIRVTKLPFTIGRSPENMLVLDDLCVARKHCRIVEKNGTFLLEDVGTANKIFAGGNIQDQVVLSHQLTFYIGNVEFRVEMGMSRSGHTHLYQGSGEKYYE